MRKHERSLVRLLHDEIGDPRHGVEVGVWKGELSAVLLREFPNLLLKMIDLWEPEDGSKSMKKKDSTWEAMMNAERQAAENTHFAKERRWLWKAESTKEADLFHDKVFDFVFIDADHFYESVRADVEAWWPKVRIGGILCGHDYDGQGDRRKGWGVKRAVDEFFGNLGLPVRVLPGLVWWVKKEK